ncbi:MAG: TetR/AcrR family transcriptional regulator, partial [Melioribacteraceae bacterium]
MPLKINIANHIKKSFSTNGYKKILVNKIISELGISKKTFYQNCSSKEFLIDEILFGFIQDAYVEVIRILSTKSDFIEKYNSIFE